MDRESIQAVIGAPAQAEPTINWVSIAIFIVLAFGISWALWLTLGALGVAFGTRAVLGMFGPAVACLLVRLLRREGFSDAGLPVIGSGVRGIGRLYLAAYGVPLVLLVVGGGLALLLGGADGVHEHVDGGSHELVDLSRINICRCRRPTPCRSW